MMSLKQRNHADSDPGTGDQAANTPDPHQKARDYVHNLWTSSRCSVSFGPEGMYDSPEMTIHGFGSLHWEPNPFYTKPVKEVKPRAKPNDDEDGKAKAKKPMKASGTGGTTKTKGKDRPCGKWK